MPETQLIELHHHQNLLMASSCDRSGGNGFVRYPLLLTGSAPKALNAPA
jgi:hypothetical protein